MNNALSDKWDEYTEWDSSVIKLTDYGVTIVKIESDGPVIGFTPFCEMWGESCH